jgi:hypothetical protein
MLALAVGTFIAAAVIGGAGVGAAVVVIGGAAIVATASGTVWFVRAGGDVPPPPHDVVERLLADPVFADLDVPTLDRLAHRAAKRRLPAGTEVITEGEAGDRYYLVIDGWLTVRRRDRAIRRLGAGDSFGEVALVHDVPRTATVTCVTASELIGVDRGDFLAAVTVYPRSFLVATTIADRHLAATADG